MYLEGSVLSISKHKNFIAVGMSTGLTLMIEIQEKFFLRYQDNTHEFGVNVISLKNV